MLLRKGSRMDRGLGLIEAEVEEEEEVVEGEGEGKEEGVEGRGWEGWMTLGGRSVRAVRERNMGVGIMT